MKSYLIYEHNNKHQAINSNFNLWAFVFGIFWLLYNKMFFSILFFLSLQLICNFISVKYSNDFIVIIPSLCLGLFAGEILALQKQLQGFKLVSLTRAMSNDQAIQRYLDLKSY
ncbi:DUF2628 domain-containing protein [Rickettsiales endosymbiont of Stachyamoeba lipophora]|uniref:DUF2628 domain-containing protein n=1 Tax=Rickettsiales endosymbiont of Stachyamoeba lipophora TaxID=2486578 RepID=UPI000F652A8E|nr:DUF2628 domain-containing protein [Rickettsiales endosymbiont of Stachyamoeba lipophora]AZL15297.1 DUF2628 domain-containing protein [Rickettsiales endosymbiont of Stachyamoeba lipophora]